MHCLGNLGSKKELLFASCIKGDINCPEKQAPNDCAPAFLHRIDTPRQWHQKKGISMQIGEEVAALGKLIMESSLCRGENEPKLKGKCRIGETGSPGDLPKPTPERLYKNMRKPSSGVILPDMPSKINPKPRKPNWDLEECDPNCFPFQSHHLIPKKHLPSQKVCVWLAKNAANSHWKLIESTNYDTDDAQNGMPLPFVSTTYQWDHSKVPKKDEEKQKWLCYEMMWRTGKQLHQGSHTIDDFGEEDSLHANEEPGYLGAVDELLKVVNGQTLNHVWFCNDCNKSKSKPYEVRPLERVVESMHQVSKIMGSIITGFKRFVSERSAEYWQMMRGR